MKLRIIALLALLSFFAIDVVQAQIAYPRFQKHQVLDGETASSIAEQFNVSLSDFCLLNDFPEDVQLKYGQVVLVRQLKAGEEEIVEDPLPLKKEPAKTSAPAKEAAITRKEETPVVKEKPQPVAETRKSAPETKVVAEEPFVVPPPSTKSVEIGPGGTRYNVTQSEYHVVQKGQTFFRIALIYGMSVDELKELNGLSSTTIEIGQRLKVRK